MTCYQIKMSQFITYLLNEMQRPDNWEELHSEYIGLRENKNSKYMLTLLKDIAVLKAQYQIVLDSVKILTVQKVDDLVAILKSYGFRKPYDWNSPGSYSADLKSALSGAKRWISQWEEKEKELEKLTERYAGKEMQRKDYYVHAITLGTWRKVHVDLDQISAAEWCLMCNQYEQFCEAENAKRNNMIRNGKH